MSQTATSPVVRPLPRAATSTPLRVIRSNMSSGSKGAFIAACIALLLGGLIALLILNTLIASSSVGVHQLQDRSNQLTAQHAQLAQDLAERSSSIGLARQAIGAGMVRPNGVGFLDLGKGQVIGVPSPATQDQAVSFVSSPNRPAPLPDLTGVLSVTPPPPPAPPAPASPAAAAPSAPAPQPAAQAPAPAPQPTATPQR